MDEQQQLLADLVRSQSLRRARAWSIAAGVIAAAFAFAWFVTRPEPEPAVSKSSLAAARRLDPVAAAERQRCIEKLQTEPDAIRRCAAQFPDRNEPEEGVSKSHGLSR